MHTRYYSRILILILEGVSHLKKLHKINAVTIWIVSALLIVFVTTTRGWSTTTIKCDIGMITGVILMTFLYFSKANDIVKGSGMTVIIAIACLFTSISLDGDAAIFTLSFILLGMALLYFNQKIIISYLAIYIPACIIAAFINPAYIVGPEGTLSLCIESIFTYGTLGFLMILATRRGEGLINTSKKMLEEIQHNTKKTEDVIEKLNVSMDESFQHIEKLTVQTQSINDSTYEIESLTKSMDASANTLSALVSDTVVAINQNEALNIQLEEQFEKVKNAVQDGNEGAINVKSTLDTMKDTVLVAGEATDTLLSKISAVDEILKEINKITLRTKILSLNASIEAAKAGAAGRGFLVVAEEISGLAAESKDSSISIQNIIEELNLQIRDVAEKTSAGTKAAIDGLESMQSLIITLGKIKDTNDIVANVVSQETQTNSKVNSKFDSVSSELSNLISSVLSISDTIENVSSDIYKQNNAIKKVNEETGKMKSVIENLNKKNMD